MGATLAAALIMGAVAGGSLPTGYTSPEDRYEQSIRRTVEKQADARAEYRVERTEQYVTEVKRSRAVRKAPASPKFVPPVSRQPIDGKQAEPTSTTRTTRAGESADLAWVMGVLADHGLATKGSTWTVTDAGSCGKVPHDRWNGCTTMTSPADVKIHPRVIGTQLGAHVVVHEWVHAVERNRDECSTEARTKQITGHYEVSVYAC